MFCKFRFSEELRRWFLEKELDLFKFRFLQEGKESIQMFLTLNNLTYNPVSCNSVNFIA